MSPSPTVYLLALCAVVLVTSLAMNAVRLERPLEIYRETRHLFLTITLGILILCVIVALLESLLIRPLW